MKSFLILICVALVAAGGFVGGLAYRAHRDSAGNGITTQKPKRRILFYVDRMHPAYKSDKPGIAPDCGMKLEPVYADDVEAQTTDRGILNISPEQQRLIGVQYGQAELTTSSNPFRASGKVALDETRLVRVHPKVEGWIEKVLVDFTGAPVEKGQPLLTIYSPDMLAAEQDYLLALQARKILRSSPLAEAAQNSDSLLKASRTRLELWDLSPAQMDEIERTGNTIHAITLYAPAGGFVTARNAFPSQKVTPDTQLYEIGDLSRVWIMADVFESDAANVRMGQAASVTTAYRNGMRLAARVSFIQPQVDAATRTMKVRLEAPNPGFQLKPDMFVDIEFQVASQRRLTVPAEAVLDAGIRKTVFVDHGDGHLEARQVEIGERLGDRVEILGGLKPGERIVTSGNFLIDSESQLKQALQGSTDSGDSRGAQPSAKSPAHPPGHPHD
jgi:Cu(I)/Ag(I) efflux system membrane fusion protein